MKYVVTYFYSLDLGSYLVKLQYGDTEKPIKWEIKYNVLNKSFS